MGTLQKLPRIKDAGSDDWLSLIRITRNIADSARPQLGGRIVTITDEKALDAQMPNWHERDYLPFTHQVRHYIYDENNPYEFYVYQGNDGTGFVEAIVGYCPPMIKPTGDETSLSSWGREMGRFLRETARILCQRLAIWRDEDAMDYDPHCPCVMTLADASIVSIERADFAAFMLDVWNAPIKRQQIMSDMNMTLKSHDKMQFSFLHRAKRGRVVTVEADI